MVYIITFIQYFNNGQINLSLISKHDEMRNQSKVKWLITWLKTASNFLYHSSICSVRGLRHHRQIDRYRDSKHRLLLTVAHKGIFFLLYFHTQQIKVVAKTSGDTFSSWGLINSPHLSDVVAPSPLINVASNIKSF